MSLPQIIRTMLGQQNTDRANMIANGLTNGSNPGLGITVIRPAAADPQNVWQTIFTVAGGVVAVKALIGVRTVIQAGGASTMQFQHTVGPAVWDSGAGAITGDDVGATYTITGDPTDPIQLADLFGTVFLGRIVATSVRYGPGPLGLLLCGTGNIQVTMTAAAGTGSTGYTIVYTPVTVGATIVAA